MKWGGKKFQKQSWLLSWCFEIQDIIYYMESAQISGQGWNHGNISEWEKLQIKRHDSDSEPDNTIVVIGMYERKTP